MSRAPLSPRKLAAVRRAFYAGRGALLGLDEVPGIVEVRITDSGGPEDQSGRLTMERGTALAEVWTTGVPADVFEAIHRSRAAGVLVVAIVRRPGLFRRFRRFFGWILRRRAIRKKLRGRG